MEISRRVCVRRRSCGSFSRYTKRSPVKSVHGDQSFNKQIGQLDEESEAGGVGDESLKFFADAVDHKLRLLPFDELAFGVGGAALGVGIGLGDFGELDGGPFGGLDGVEGTHVPRKCDGPSNPDSGGWVK